MRVADFLFSQRWSPALLTNAVQTIVEMRFSAVSFALLVTSTMACGDTEQRPKALVYRGPAACNGCPEAVAALLQSSPSNFEVDYAGPNEKIDINEASLQHVQLYAQPGGGGTHPCFGSSSRTANSYSRPRSCLPAYEKVQKSHSGLCRSRRPIRRILLGRIPGRPKPRVCSTASALRYQ